MKYVSNHITSHGYHFGGTCYVLSIIPQLVQFPEKSLFNHQSPFLDAQTEAQRVSESAGIETVLPGPRCTIVHCLPLLCWAIRTTSERILGFQSVELRAQLPSASLAEFRGLHSTPCLGYPGLDSFPRRQPRAVGGAQL